MCTSHCQDRAFVQCIQSKEEFRLYTQVYTFKSLHLCHLHCVCTVTDEQCFCLHTMDSVWKSAYLLVQDSYVSLFIAMFYEFEATVFFILRALPEAVRGVRSGVRQSNLYVSSPCASYLGTIEKPMVSCSSEVYCHIFLPTMLCWKEKPWMYTVE